MDVFILTFTFCENSIDIEKNKATNRINIFFIKISIC